ncbi:MAG: prolyl oligopeptidase family serine peptidase [Pseudomonadota bacterium]
MALTGPTKPAASGTARSLVILLHGYGADGNDLIGLADPLSTVLPDTVFTAPNAPERCANNPFGYQWFPIPWMDGSTEAQMASSFESSIADLNGYLDSVAEETGIAPAQTVLLGFSQGTMMSLHVGPRRAEGYAGIIGFSGRLLVPEALTEVVTKPPVLLIHGDADPVVPYASMGEAETALKAADFQVATHTSPGTPHGIAPDGLQMAAGFLQSVLG